MSDAVRTFLQGNLKAFTGVHPTPDLFDELALAICEHHTALEHLCLQQQFNAWSVITSSLLQQPHAQSLRAFPVSAQQQTDGVLPCCGLPRCFVLSSVDVSNEGNHSRRCREVWTLMHNTVVDLSCVPALVLRAGRPGVTGALYWGAGY